MRRGTVSIATQRSKRQPKKRYRKLSDAQKAAVNILRRLDYGEDKVQRIVMGYIAE